MSIEQKMHYQMQLEESKKKKKKALIAVCTLGLSETPLVQLFKESEDTKRQMSFGNSPAGGIFKIIWFLLWTVITMAVLWVVNIFRLINYGVHCHQLKKAIASE